MTAAVFTLHGALRRSAEQYGDRPAIVTGEETVTWAMLDERAGRVAAALAELGVQAGDRVAVAAGKSPATVAALYGIMRAGAAYVPVDPASPPLRARHVLSDAGVSAVCLDAARAERLDEVVTGVGVPALRVDDPSLDSVRSDDRLRGCESDLAYVLYTSGSTGAPKGVMLSHRNALAFVEWAVGRFAVSHDDRLSSHAPLHFDLSVFDLYGAALTGASVHLLAAEQALFGTSLVEAVRRDGLTVWYSVPSALTMMLDAAAPEDLASLRVVLFAGEVFPTRHLRRLRALLPHATLANLYGPTETNVCTYWVVPERLPEGDDPIPIGSACENQEVFALDDELRVVADGDVGELWVRGPTVMQGYLGDAGRTAERRRQHPGHDLFPDPTYRTGDLVRRGGDGCYQFLGRRDHQVKSRGYRIELGEVEAALTSHPSIREAVVVPVPDERAGNLLVAFAAADGEVDPIALKRHCAERVPRYMIPTTIELCESLPRTTTGKVDRQMLTARVQDGR